MRNIFNNYNTKNKIRIYDYVYNAQNKESDDK